MSRDERKRQKKLLKKRRKDKERKKKSFFDRVSETDEYVLKKRLIKNAREYPVDECLISEDWKERGLADILLARKQPNGNVIIGVYLVDIFCLGLKNTFCNADLSPAEYEKFKATILHQESHHVFCHPRLASRIVHGGIEYARKLGFEPQKDFKLSRFVLPEYSEEDLAFKVEFGKNGKPFYITGPDDDVDYIIMKLKNKVGEGNFDFLFLDRDSEDYFAEESDDSFDDDSDDFEEEEPDARYIENPPLSDIDAPAGFMSISVSQAIMKYAKPVQDFFEKGVLKDFNDIMKLAMPLWNYGLEGPRQHEETREDIISLLMKELKLGQNEASEFFDMMIERKKYLFPQDIQPKLPTTMFIRKEKKYDISEFDYNSLNMTEKPYMPDDEDKTLIGLINQMDRYIEDETEYKKWEGHYFEMEKMSKKCFWKWLEFKGVGKEYSDNFCYNVESFLNFLYRYTHDAPGTLKTVDWMHLDEFFTDYLLRKVMAEPQEYAKWPPALKLFYAFLKDIGYLDNSEEIIELFDDFEPDFIGILKGRYS